MPNKQELTKQAEDLGISVDPEWTKDQIQDAINEQIAKAESEQQPPSDTEPVSELRQEMLDQAAELNIEGAEGMDDKQLSVAIEQASEKTLFINVPKRVVTLKGIVVEAGVLQISEFDLNSIGLLPHQYEVAEQVEDVAP